MDLMSASTTYADLAKKYQNFGAPTIRIRVEGTEIVEKVEAGISSLSLDLTAGFSASGCSFDVVGEYGAKNTGFDDKGPIKLLQLGAKVEIEIGYIKTEDIFTGLIAEVEYVFDNEDSAPYVHVECMDAKCLLMKHQRLQIFSEKTVTDAVGEILDAQPFSAYITGKQIDADNEKLDMLPAAMEDDYRFMVRHAQRLGYEFFIVQGKAYFRKTPTSSSSIVTLSPDSGLLSFKQSLRGGALFKKARVVGINPADDKAISGEATISGKFGEGKGSSRMLGESEKVIFDHNIISAQQAEAMAKVLMQNARASFGTLHCRCVGIPELVPGRSITIDGISPEADKSYYITEIRHTLDERGFFTEVEARVDSL